MTCFVFKLVGQSARLQKIIAWLRPVVDARHGIEANKSTT